MSDPRTAGLVAAEPLDEDKIVAAILAVDWFMQHGLEAGARRRERLVSEYREMLDLVQQASKLSASSPPS